MSAFVHLVRKDARLVSSVLVPTLAAVAVMWVVWALFPAFAGWARAVWSGVYQPPRWDDRLAVLEVILIGVCVLVPCGLGVAVVHGDRLRGGALLACVMPQADATKVFSKVFVLASAVALCLACFAFNHVLLRQSSVIDPPEMEWYALVIGGTLLSAASGLALAAVMRSTAIAVLLGLATPVCAALVALGTVWVCFKLPGLPWSAPAQHADELTGVNALLNNDAQRLAGAEHDRLAQAIRKAYETAVLRAMLLSCAVAVCVLAVAGWRTLAARTPRVGPWASLGLACAAVMGASALVAAWQGGTSAAIHDARAKLTRVHQLHAEIAAMPMDDVLTEAIGWLTMTPEAVPCADAARRARLGEPAAAASLGVLRGSRMAQGERDPVRARMVGERLRELPSHAPSQRRIEALLPTLDALHALRLRVMLARFTDPTEWKPIYQLPLERLCQTRDADERDALIAWVGGLDRPFDNGSSPWLETVQRAARVLRKAQEGPERDARTGDTIRGLGHFPDLLPCALAAVDTALREASAHPATPSPPG